jgi:hypothetical protein
MTLQARSHLKNPCQQKNRSEAVFHYFAAFAAAFLVAVFAVTAAAVFFLRGRSLPNDPTWILPRLDL